MYSSNFLSRIIGRESYAFSWIIVQSIVMFSALDFFWNLRMFSRSFSSSRDTIWFLSSVFQSKKTAISLKMLLTFDGTLRFRSQALVQNHRLWHRSGMYLEYESFSSSAFSGRFHLQIRDLGSGLNPPHPLVPFHLLIWVRLVRICRYCSYYRDIWTWTFWSN